MEWIGLARDSRLVGILVSVGRACSMSVLGRWYGTLGLRGKRVYISRIGEAVLKTLETKRLPCLRVTKMLTTMLQNGPSAQLGRTGTPDAEQRPLELVIVMSLK